MFGIFGTGYTSPCKRVKEKSPRSGMDSLGSVNTCAHMHVHIQAGPNNKNSQHTHQNTCTHSHEHTQYSRSHPLFVLLHPHGFERPLCGGETERRGRRCDRDDRQMARGFQHRSALRKDGAPALSTLPKSQNHQKLVNTKTKKSSWARSDQT